MTGGQTGRSLRGKPAFRAGFSLHRALREFEKTRRSFDEVNA
jgi:hypothetical protein